jgi:glucose/arabinose dehydrogenase
VGTRKEDKVYAVVDRNGDHVPEAVHVIADGLNSPNGLAYRDGSLYVAEIGRIIRFDDIDRQIENPPEPVVVTEELPDKGHHGWRYMDFGPDGLLYIPIGAPCNNCTRDNPLFASIARLSLPKDGPASKLEVFAHGVRNSVGLAWHPQTKELWFTENGRDEMGDDLPPDELNRAPQSGLHFGYPACHAGVIVDPEFGHLRTCAESTPPAQNLDPHVAALGMEFTHGRGWAAPHEDSVLIAEHGSWNRDVKLGYRITEVQLLKGKAKSYRPFITGWVDAERDEVYGRPVDLEFLDDGSLLISDDWQGAIYRVTKE